MATVPVHDPYFCVLDFLHTKQIKHSLQALNENESSSEKNKKFRPNDPWDWDAADLFGGFTWFRDHVQFVFVGPLSELNPKQKAGWLGTWIGAHGREVYKTFTREETEKDDPYKVLDRFETYCYGYGN